MKYIAFDCHLQRQEICEELMLQMAAQVPSRTLVSAISTYQLDINSITCSVVLPQNCNYPKAP